MGTAVLQPQDCLKNSLHLGAFNFRPPQPSTKRHGKKMAPALPPPPPPPPLSASSSASRKPRRIRPKPQQQTQPPPPPPPPQHLKQQRQVRKKLACAAEKSAGEAKTEPRKPLVMGEVRILKRGEDSKLAVLSLLGVDRHPVAGAAVSEGSKLPISASGGMGQKLMSSGSRDSSKRSSSSSCSADRRPNFVGSCYAGSGFFSSPPPSSLPFPNFLLRKADRGDSEGDRAKE